MGVYRFFQDEAQRISSAPGFPADLETFSIGDGTGGVKKKKQLCFFYGLC